MINALVKRVVPKIERAKSEHMHVIDKILREGIPELRELVLSMHSQRIDYEVEGGECYGFYLWNDSERGSGQLNFLSRGARFPEHVHEMEDERLICLTGSFSVVTDEDVQTVMPMDSVLFLAGTPHYCNAEEDSWLVGITQPASESYPK